MRAILTLILMMAVIALVPRGFGAETTDRTYVDPAKNLFGPDGNLEASKEDELQATVLNEPFPCPPSICKKNAYPGATTLNEEDSKILPTGAPVLAAPVKATK